MNLKTILPVALVGGAVLYFISKAQAGKNIKVNLFGLGTGGGKVIPNLFLKFQILNGTNTPITINSVIGEVFINGKFFATVSNTETFTIAKNSESFYSVKLTPSALSSIAIVINLLKNKQNVIVEFNGTVNSSGMLIPVKQKISAV